MTVTMPDRATQRETIYDLIRTKGGLADFETEEITGWIHQSVSAQRREMVRDGYIREQRDADGKIVTRLTPRNVPAKVWETV